MKAVPVHTSRLESDDGVVDVYEPKANTDYTGGDRRKLLTDTLSSGMFRDSDKQKRTVIKHSAASVVLAGELSAEDCVRICPRGSFSHNA